MQKTPFLTGFPTKLFGSPKKKTQEIVYEKRRSLIAGTLDYQQQFIEEIPPELLERHSNTQRKRHYTDSLTFWAFFSQVASDDASCAAAVARVQAWAEQRGLPIPSQNTGAYCQSRADIPVKLLREVNKSLYQQLEAQVPSHHQWRGLRPRVEDGTTAQMPDTAINREEYPYPHGQQEGCGFPMIRLGGLIDLSHGGLCEFATSDMNTSELHNHKQLESKLHKGDVFIVDRYYSSYELMKRLSSKGIHFIGRTHQARKIDFKKGVKISPNERLVNLGQTTPKTSGQQLECDPMGSLAR